MKTTPLPILNIEKLKAQAQKATKSQYSTAWKAKQKLKVLERYGFQCAACSSKDNLTIDHIFPVYEIKKIRKSKALHGRWLNKYIKTAQVLCFFCHQEKNGVPESKIMKLKEFS